MFQGIVILSLLFIAVAQLVVIESVDHLHREVVKTNIRIGNLGKRVLTMTDGVTEDMKEIRKYTEDTHLKMLRAYNEIAKIKVHGKHVRKETAEGEKTVND